MTEQERTESPTLPYATHLNILFEQLQKIDVPALVNGSHDG